MGYNTKWSTANTESFTAGFLSFSGRLNRFAFFMRLLAVIILPTLAILVMWLVVALIPLIGFVLWPLALGLTIIIAILSTIAYIALHVRRLHDMGLSGLWYLLILAISIAGRPDEFVEYLHFLDYPVDAAVAAIARAISLIILLVLLFYPGTRGANKYGPDPLSGGAIEKNRQSGRTVIKSKKADPYDEDNFWRQ